MSGCSWLLKIVTDDCGDVAAVAVAVAAAALCVSLREALVGVLRPIGYGVAAAFRFPAEPDVFLLAVVVGVLVVVVVVLLLLLLLLLIDALPAEVIGSSTITVMPLM